uniref:DUF3106 domain-containing protein n=1 Tax=uncultured bacterium pTW3 TaxID=504467 RepID=B8PZY1_9BACT|nr:hypothetical protein [uncultured bacterium pTW3]
MHTPHPTFRLARLGLLLALAAGTALAGDRTPPPQAAAAPTLPAWEQLSPAQREVLIAPLRERWNANPGERARTYAHAQGWQSMTPEQRTRARHGLHRWERMDPERRTQMRALFGQMRSMTPEQRKALRERWHAMTPEQRRAWVQAHPPGADE